MFRDLIEEMDDDAPEPKEFLDVPFVPTDDVVIKAMLRLAKVGRKDMLYDLGAGDGRIVVTAARTYGTRGIGIEIDPVRIADAMELAGDLKVEFLVDFIEDDIFTADISEATVVTLYLLDSVNLQLRPRLLSELRPGARIVSHAFSMGDWKPDEQQDLGGITLYKWVVPGQVAGEWEWEGVDGTLYQVELEQRFQEVNGQAWETGQLVALQEATLQGNTLYLTLKGDGVAQPRDFTLSFEEGELVAVEEH